MEFITFLKIYMKIEYWLMHCIDLLILQKAKFLTGSPSFIKGSEISPICTCEEYQTGLANRKYTIHRNVECTKCTNLHLTSFCRRWQKSHCGSFLVCSQALSVTAALCNYDNSVLQEGFCHASSQRPHRRKASDSGYILYTFVVENVLCMSGIPTHCAVI